MINKIKKEIEELKNSNAFQKEGKLSSYYRKSISWGGRMINKIKKEIEELKNSNAFQKDGRLSSYNQCLKWAKALEKELKEKTINSNTCSKGYIDIIELEEIIEKAFHGGELVR